MKILNLGKFYPIRGGVEKVEWDMTVGTSERGIPCDMLCATLKSDPVDPPDQPRCTITPEGKVIRLNDFGRVICVPAITKKAATMISPAMIRWVRRHCKEYDIIHIHQPDPMATFALWLSGYKGRVIVQWESDILSQKVLLALYKPLQSWLIRRAELIICTAPVYMRESAFLQDVQDKVTCVPIGILPIKTDENATSAMRNRYPGKKIVLSLGRLVPYKGFEYMIAAAAHLGDDYQVLIGGKGPLQESLQAQIDSLDLQDRVKLLGYVPDEDIPALYGACDVFVISSIMKTEAFGIVQIEAMSCGKPVVSTRIPHSGVPWVIEDGVSGLNVEPRDPEAIADAVRRICEDPQTWRAFSEEARKRFDRMFTAKMMIDKMIDIYERNC